MPFSETVLGKYEITDQKIGSGTFSDVYLGYVISSRECIAVKKIKLQEDGSENEMNLAESLIHDNIVKFMDIVVEPKKKYIIMEYCNSGTLEDVITYHENLASIDSIENSSRYYLKQLRSAVCFLNYKSITHRDIKPANILVKGCGIIGNKYNPSNKPEIKLSDFGLTKTGITGNMTTDTICGSPFYMAPELLFGSGYTNKVDLWSFGIIMFQLLHGRSITNISKMLSHLDETSCLSADCLDLLKKLLVRDPAMRISWSDFASHPWFVNSNPISISAAGHVPISSQRYSNDYIESTIGLESPPNSLGICNLSRMAIPSSKIQLPKSCPSKVYDASLGRTSTSSPTISMHNDPISLHALDSEPDDDFIII